MKCSKQTILVLSLLLLSLLSYSQIKDIASIRKAYSETKVFCEQSENTTQVKYERTIPALGPSYTTVNFCGYEKLGEDEASHPWENDGIIKLRFVSVKYNIAAPTVELEYLYDLETQRIIFYYEKDSYNEKEYRYYFKEKQLIKVVTNTLADESSDAEDERPKYEATENFTEEVIKKGNQIVNKSKVYKEQFTQLYGLEKIEKR